MSEKTKTVKKEKSIQIIPMDIPETNRSSKYDTAVQDFLATGKESAAVKVDGTSNRSVWFGLKKATTKTAEVEVVTKNKEVYLRRITK